MEQILTRLPELAPVLLPIWLAFVTHHRLCLIETIALSGLAAICYFQAEPLLAAVLLTFALINAARGFERRAAAERQKHSSQRIQELDQMVERFLTGLDRRSRQRDFAADPDKPMPRPEPAVQA